MVRADKEAKEEATLFFRLNNTKQPYEKHFFCFVNYSNFLIKLAKIRLCAACSFETKTQIVRQAFIENDMVLSEVRTIYKHPIRDAVPKFSSRHIHLKERIQCLPQTWVIKPTMQL